MVETNTALGIDRPNGAVSSALVAGSLQAFVRFLSAVRSIESVRRVACSSVGPELYVWVLMCEENLSDADRIYLLERDFRQQAGLVPVEVRVIPLSEVDERSLPPAETILER